MNLFMTIIIDFRLFLRKILIFLQMLIPPAQLLTLFINGLYWDLFLLVKRTKMESETMFTSDLVNLASQLPLTLDEPPKRKTAKILNLQLQQMKGPKGNQNRPSFCYYCKKPGHWKTDCYKFKHFKYLQPLARLSSVLPIVQEIAGAPPSPPS